MGAFLLFYFYFFKRVCVDIYISFTELALSYPHVVYSALGIICRNLSNPRLLSALICMSYVSVMSVCYGRTA